jgi:membrane-bound serine protease (ClpP class)
MNWILDLMTNLTASTAGSAATMAANEPNTAYIIAAFALVAGAMLFFTLELFVPSGGLFATLCGACSIASVVTMFLYTPALGGILLFAYVIAGPFAIYWGIRIWENSPVGRRLILDAELDSAISDDLPENTDVEGSSQKTETIRDLIGLEGVSDSPLRPVGFVNINGRRVDAIAEGDMIEAGERVHVVDAYDNQLKVRLIDPGTT